MSIFFLVTLSLVIALFASYFFYIGNTKYGDKGLFLGVTSIMLAMASLTFTRFGFLGIIGANVLLFLIILLYDRLRKK